MADERLHEVCIVKAVPASLNKRGGEFPMPCPFLVSTLVELADVVKKRGAENRLELEFFQLVFPLS